MNDSLDTKVNDSLDAKVNDSLDTQPNKPKFWSRATLEPLTASMILGGIVMLMQPFWMVLYSYSFMVILVGTIGFSIATKLKD